MIRTIHLVSAAAAMLSAAAFGSDAPNNTVYRCGSVYSHVPCGDGKPIDVGAAPTDAQRADARKVAADERRRAEQMTRDRLTEEAEFKRVSAAQAASRSKTELKLVVLKLKLAAKKPTAPKSGGDFIARVPQAKAAKV